MNFYAIIINIGLDSNIELIHFQSKNECIEYLKNFNLEFNREYHTSTLIKSKLFETFNIQSGDEHCFIDIQERSFGKQYLTIYNS